MYLPDHAQTAPDKPALIFSNGARVSFAELDERSNRLAQLLRARGLKRGDHIALFMENNQRYFDVVWAAFRSGLHITPINRYLTIDEAAYIANDCGARAIVSSYARRDVGAHLPAHVPGCGNWLMTDGAVGGWEAYEIAVAEFPAEPVADERIGESMFYSSGTTGRPKGILRTLPDIHPADGFALRQAINRYGFSEETIYLSPAPLYHAAPFAFVLSVLSFGGTAIIMEKFDAALALELIERHRVTHSQWVPTMFVRMLKLPQNLRGAFDLSSHRIAVHAAAPCPVEVKQQMIAWWGPILHEYYAGSEGTGATTITSEEWLAHPGSVGRSATSVVHVCDDDGHELPAGESGLIYFEQPAPTFRYHNDDAKTLASRHPEHPNWSTLGDIGYLDAEGFLFLTDRKAFMIISGGVNIYPQAIEDIFVLHPKVADVAVFGVPDEEMGESVKAVIEPQPGVEPSPALARELLEFARTRLAHYTAPKSIDFITEMPRLPTGKLYKRLLRDRYWQKPVAKN